MIKKATKEKVIDYVAYFFIYSFLGWIIETIYALIIHGEFIKRGFLFGPLCPIYGFGAIILLLTTKKMYGKPFAKFLIATVLFTVFEYFVSLIFEMYGKPFAKFLIATVLFTVFEYFVSLIFEEIFGLRWWDYSNDFLNIQGRVSLMYTIFWGLIGLILLEKLHPAIETVIQKIEVKIKTNAKITIVYILIAILISDFVLSCLNYLKI